MAALPAKYVGLSLCGPTKADMARVLLIEDNPLNRKLTTLVLRTAGHVVIHAVDAESGLEQARAELPDLILMDIQLPGMSGLEATQLLKKEVATSSIPVIAITALAMKGDPERIAAAGCDGYIAKPIRYEQLWNVIEKYVIKASADSTQDSK
jgi:CheY-like chemotaxis protein